MFEEFENKSEIKKVSPLLFLVSSILLTLFLFFIDEGNYSFNWMENALNLIVLGIYAIPMFLAQWLVYRLLPKKLTNKEKYLFSIPTGLILGTSLVIGSFYFFG